MAGQLEGASPSGQLPEKSPLEPAKVLATAGNVSLQHVKRLSKASFLPVIVRLIHFGRVNVPPRQPLNSRQRDGCDRRTDGDNDQQRQRRRERRPAPAPTPDILALSGDLRADRLEAEEVTERVRQFLPRRIAGLRNLCHTVEANGFEVE